MNSATIEAIAAVAELSRCDRLGIKGKCAPVWLKMRGLDVPSRPNRLLTQRDGLMVARYGETEFAFADFHNANSSAVDDLRRALEQDRPDGCFSVPLADSQAAFGLSGEAAMRALSAVCPADMRARAFGPGDVIQTLCAAVSARLWNISNGHAARVVVLCDSSVARHQRAALCNAMTATGERAVTAWFDSASIT